MRLDTLERDRMWDLDLDDARISMRRHLPRSSFDSIAANRNIIEMVAWNVWMMWLECRTMNAPCAFAG